MEERKEEKKRKLSKAELKRKALFEEKKEKLEEQGYTYKNLSIGVVYANVMAIVSTAPVIVLLFIFYFLFKREDMETEIHFNSFFIFYLIFLLLIVVHELIHGFVWGLFAENHYKDISFGVIWSMLTPYCCCSTTLKKYQYLIGGMMPTIILGILPSVYGLITGNFPVFVIGLFMILGGGADLVICIKMLFYKSECKEILFMDHPYECGFVIFER